MAHDLHLPADGNPTSAAIVLHPHPAMGGDRHHPLVVAVAEALAAVGVAALRPDLEDPDVAVSTAALEQLAVDLPAEVDTDRLALVGYSWGSVVSAMAEPAALAARVLVAPPMGVFDVPAPKVSTLVLVPAHDQYGSPDEVRAAMGHHQQATIEVVEGCDHFLAGAVGRITARTVDWLYERVDLPNP